MNCSTCKTSSDQHQLRGENIDERTDSHPKFAAIGFPDLESLAIARSSSVA
tara:strand:+ start:363 stop:515 length:153 start_codon:yes stop_codon:yes gene_type:complete